MHHLVLIIWCCMLHKYLYSRMHTHLVKNLMWKPFQMLFQSMRISKHCWGDICSHTDPIEWAASRLSCSQQLAVLKNHIVVNKVDITVFDSKLLNCLWYYPFEAWINFEEILKSTCSLKWYITSTHNTFWYKTIYHIEAH